MELVKKTEDEITLSDKTITPEDLWDNRGRYACSVEKVSGVYKSCRKVSITITANDYVGKEPDKGCLCSPFSKTAFCIRSDSIGFQLIHTIIYTLSDKVLPPRRGTNCVMLFGYAERLPVKYRCLGQFPIARPAYI